MKKRMIKYLAAGVLAATSVVSLASCGGGGSSELTIFLYQEGVKYDSNMEVFKKANEYAGVSLKGILQRSDTNYETIYNMRGKDANLVVNDQDTIESTALRNGSFVDLTNLIEEYAPNLKAFFEANPEKKTWAQSSDGKIYGIPFYTDGQTAKGYFIRKDWVDILDTNKKLPSGVNKDKLDELTVEQFHDLLVAFKENYKLFGLKETFTPYFDRDSDFAISELASLWGASAESYVDDKGNVVYGAVQDSFRTALENIQTWYKEGLIEKNILTSGTEDKRDTYFLRNTGGATHDWIGTTYSYNDDCYETSLVEGFELVCIAPPTRADGTKFEPTIRKQIGKVTAINKKTSEEDQIKLIKWIDYFFSVEGQEMSNFGIEGVDFTKENGEYKYTDKIINDNATALANLYSVGAQLQYCGVQNFKYEEAWLSTEAKDAMQEYQTKNYLNLAYNDLIFPNIKMNTEDYKAVNTAKSACTDVYNSQIYKWIKNGDQINDSSWNSYVSAMEKAGSNTITSTLQKYVK